jgi:hypothetical protein
MTKIPGGYYIKARQIKDSSIAHAPPYVREIWDYLLREACHCDTKYDGYELKRGQLFRSYKQIRKDLSWNVGYRTEYFSENQMKMGMRHLMKQLMITVTKQPRGNVITILNYSYFQDPGNYETTNETTNETTKRQPRDNQGVPSIYKKIKKIKNKTYCAEFELFWNAYPNKTGKKPAAEKWQRLNGTRPDIQIILSAVETQKKSRKWKEGYVPNPVTWLNQERWNDEIEPTLFSNSNTPPYWEEVS